MQYFFGMCKMSKVCNFLLHGNYPHLSILDVHENEKNIFMLRFLCNFFFMFSNCEVVIKFF
jgi:hypothetical protein